MLNGKNIPSDAASLISPQKAFECNVLPLKLEERFFHIAVTDKNDLKLISDLSFYTGRKIKATEYPAEIILAKLKEIYPDFNSNKNNGNGKIKDNFISDYSNVEFVNQIIEGAVKQCASDIHFEVYENIFRIRYRIDGHLREILNSPHSKSPSVISRLKIMADLDISEKRRPQDGKIRYSFKNNIIDIRVSSLPTNNGEKVVLRILDKSQLQLDLRKLGLSNNEYKIISRNIHAPYGMILVTGPTGSGKTTTLYATLEEIQTVEKNILTIEDPIEYNLEGINQSNVKPDIGFDFASALRSFLRQDPDIIMVGEIRDKETAEIAVRSSLTGHLVFSTLHTNDSISAVTRLIDMGIEPFLVASSVRLIIAQRLVRKLCICKIKDGNSSNNILGVNDSFEKKGCEICGFTGYKGRTALFETFEINEEISEMITKNANYSELKRTAIKNGFKTLRDSGIEKINSGITSNEEVLRETTL